MKRLIGVVSVIFVGFVIVQLIGRNRAEPQLNGTNILPENQILIGEWYCQPFPSCKDKAPIADMTKIDFNKVPLDLKVLIDSRKRVDS